MKPYVTMAELGRAIQWTACFEIMKRSWRGAEVHDGVIWAEVTYGFSGSGRRPIRNLAAAVRMAKRDLMFTSCVI